MRSACFAGECTAWWDDRRYKRWIRWRGGSWKAHKANTQGGPEPKEPGRAEIRRRGALTEAAPTWRITLDERGNRGIP